MSRTAAETRAHLLEVTKSLFQEQGIRATGVNLIAAEAGVQPPTLYRQFASKDELIAAYVEEADQETRRNFEAAIAAAGPDPRDQLLAVFDELYSGVTTETFRGCTFLLTLSEFPDRDLPAHRGAIAAKVWVRARVGDLVDQLGVGEPDVLADQLMLVLEGLHATAQSLGPDGPIRQARRLYQSVLGNALATSG